jgi:hypothetical protein
MKRFLLPLVLGLLSGILGASAWGAESLLEYEFGNQIVRSRLVVFNDGTIEHTEHGCCPPADKPVAEPVLSGAELQELRSRILGAWGLPTETKKNPFLLGSETGHLYVYASGRRVSIRDYQIQGAQQGPTGAEILVISKLGADAVWVREWVEKYVRVKMGSDY